jgi:hypothetical protein
MTSDEIVWGNVIRLKPERPRNSMPKQFDVALANEYRSSIKLEETAQSSRHCLSVVEADQWAK